MTIQYYLVVLNLPVAIVVDTDPNVFYAETRTYEDAFEFILIQHMINDWKILVHPFQCSEGWAFVLHKFHTLQ